MKKFLFSFLFIISCFHNSSAQEIQKILIKAFQSADSSDYYFKVAKKSIKNQADEAQYYFAKNARCCDFNQLDSSIVYGEKAIKLLKNGDLPSLLTVYNNMSKVYRKQGQYDKAIQYSLDGIKIAEKTGNENWVAFYNVNLSLNYHDFESFKKGIYYGKKALNFWLKKKDTKPAYIYTALNAIAINYDDWNKPDSALYYHKKVFKYIKGKDTLTISSTYNNIGNTLLKQKKYKEAERWIKSALKISDINFQQNGGIKDSDYYYEQATYYINLARIAYELDDYKKAEAYFAKAEGNAKKSMNAEKLRDFYMARSIFNKKRNNLEKAVQDQEDYIKLRDSVFDVERAQKFSELEAKYQNEKKQKQILKSKAQLAERNLEIKKKNTQIIITLIIGLGLLIIIFLIYRQQKLKNKQQEQEFKLKSAIAKIETQNKLQEQRLQISRDLHDNIGSQLTFIISSVDNIKYAFELKNSKLDNKLSSISSFAKSTIFELRDTIWAMNHSEITFEDLQTRIHNFVEKAKEAKHDIEFDFIIDDNLKNLKFTSIEGMNIYRTIQEAINNSIKYADAKKISIQAKRLNNSIEITITDDGKGFDKANVEEGFGLKNMQKRIEEIGGKISINSKESDGTKINIILPDQR
ncbi:MAG TPA: sensor histidine kinase [Flavobacterium sp.]|uniref:tetratricopeptide repeat-containing sensor histidine kinase n=1 Tax=Flavobacterium sp. TaxID=239 RepID=UPI002C259B6F|nr:sensor histidine kinase [Flavobacterium sp.]HNP33634.1 sensor histidine kinase [Flavobacterium sp.]